MTAPAGAAQAFAVPLTIEVARAQDVLPTIGAALSTIVPPRCSAAAVMPLTLQWAVDAEAGPAAAGPPLVTAADASRTAVGCAVATVDGLADLGDLIRDCSASASARAAAAGTAAATVVLVVCRLAVRLGDVAQ